MGWSLATHPWDCCAGCLLVCLLLRAVYQQPPSSRWGCSGCTIAPHVRPQKLDATNDPKEYDKIKRIFDVKVRTGLRTKIFKTSAVLSRIEEGTGIPWKF